MPGSGNIKIHILRCGTMNVPETAAFSKGSPLSTTVRRMLAGSGKRVELPVFAFLVRHPKGNLLIDSGWPRDISPKGIYDPAAVRSILGAALADFYRPCLPIGESIPEQLSALGSSPEEIDYVILTHLDPDHCGGIKQLNGAQKIMLPEDEYFWSCRTVYKLHQPASLWADVPVERFWYRGTPIGPAKWSYDLFGDESVIVVNCPGHTDGMGAVMVKNGNRFVLFAADAAFSPRNWLEDTVPGYGFDEKRQLLSLRWVKAQALDPGCAGVFCSHDPGLKPGIFEL